MLNKRFPVTLLILALTFSLVNSQNNQTDSTPSVACPSNVSSPLECWFQTECLPCKINEQEIKCIPFTTYGTNGEVLNGQDVCKNINRTYGSYVPTLQDSLWGVSGIFTKQLNRRDLKLSAADWLNIHRLSLAYYENVTKLLLPVRDLYNITSITDMQSLVALTSNITSTLQPTINKTLTTLKNEWSMDEAQFQNYINSSQTELLEMRNLRKEVENCYLTNTSNSDLLVREYFSVSSVFYCHSSQRLQQFVTLLRQVSSLIENMQVVTLLSTYNRLGLLNERRFLCSPDNSSVPINGNNNNNDNCDENNSNNTNNGNNTNSGNNTNNGGNNTNNNGNNTNNNGNNNGNKNNNNGNNNGNNNNNGYGGDNYYGTGNNNNGNYNNNTTNNNTSNNNTTNNNISNNTANNQSCTWNNTLGYQLLRAEYVKQSVAWYHLWQIEELRAYTETFSSLLSALVTKKCEEETYIGGYLETISEQNNSCANQTNFLSNTTLFNDTMDVLLDFMEEVQEINATYVNQNETDATNVTLLFTVKRKIDWDTQDLYNVSSEFCSSLIPYLNAFMGTEYNATLCQPSLALIVNGTCSEASSSNTTASNVSSSNVSSSNVSSSSNTTACSNTTTTSENTTLVNTTISENTTVVNTTTVSWNNTVPAPEGSSNETTNTVPAPEGSTNETINGTNCNSANVTSSNNTMQNSSSPGVNNTSSNTTSTNHTHKCREIIFTIPVYLFPCNTSNTTIPATNETTPSTNCTNSTTTVPSSNGTIPAPSETIPAPNGTIPAPSETIPAPNGNENTNCTETNPSPSNNGNHGTIPAPNENENTNCEETNPSPAKTHETIPAPNENENTKTNPSPATVGNHGNGGTAHGTIANNPNDF
jgi:hypothetical protein